MHVNIYTNLDLLVIFITLHTAFMLPVATVQSLYRVGFHESWESVASRKIHTVDTYNRRNVQHNNRLMLLKKLYDTSFLGDIHFQQKPLIPKIIHQIYITEDDTAIPAIYKQLQQTWVRHHPAWRYILWQRSDIERFGLINQKQFDEATVPAVKADIARYEILYRLGGLYVDTDFLCLKPFDILHHCYDFYAGMEPVIRDKEGLDRNFIIGQALIACKPGHPILKKCIEELAHKRVHNIRDWDIVCTTGPVFFGNCLFSALTADKTTRSIVLPPTYFYPISASEACLPLYTIMKLAHQETLAVHLWAGSWLGKGSKARHEEFLKQQGNHAFTGAIRA